MYLMVQSPEPILLQTSAIGRGTEYYDKCAVDQIVLEAQQHDYKFAYLIAGIIKSEPFQKQGYRE